MNVNGFFGTSSLWNTSSTSNNSNSNSLFSTLNSNSSISLGDYAAIKNGSYKKLLKSYYSKKNGDTTSLYSKDNGLSSKEKNQVTAIGSDMSELKSAADTLKKTGKNSLFNEGENGYDYDKIYDAAKKMLDAYNSSVSSTSEISISVVDRKMELTANMFSKNSKLLEKAGIKVSDGKLTIDEEKFKSTDISTLKTLFNGNGSISDKLSKRASEIYSVSQAVLGNKNSTYNSSALINTETSTGNLLDKLL